MKFLDYFFAITYFTIAISIWIGWYEPTSVSSGIYAMMAALYFFHMAREKGGKGK